MPHQRARASRRRGPAPALVEFAQQLLTSHPKEAAHAFEPIVELLGRLLEEAEAAGALRPGLDLQRITGVVLQATMFSAFASTISASSAGPRRRGPLGSPRARHHRGMKTVRSFCRVCTSVCGILVDVEDDRVVHVRGDQEHPLSHGYTCAKGRALPQMHHHPDRLEHPMQRVDGELRPTTWDACLDDLGDRVRAIVEEHGPASVGIFFGSGNGMDAAGYRMAQALHGAIGTPAKFSPLTIDGTAKVLISDLVGGAVALSGRPDLDRAELVLVIGSNPVVSHGHSVAIPDPVSALRDLTSRAELWVIDPRRTETARLATRHLAPRPATDYALLAFLVRELLRDGADPIVLAEHVQGVDELAAAVEPFTRLRTRRSSVTSSPPRSTTCWHRSGASGVWPSTPGPA